ncbi:hypothetical protein [Actinomadura madurae]|uniref:hypothetical protein n=1 Tax=Actinomadura madurae TaxID=1993 RepID=UPI0020D1FA58|nr:hypothetical protein [Actinomadura madurae]MCQ0014236.1 hypothetical protein [Actinomadura madurae]
MQGGDGARREAAPVRLGAGKVADEAERVGQEAERAVGVGLGGGGLAEAQRGVEAVPGLGGEDLLLRGLGAGCRVRHLRGVGQLGRGVDVAGVQQGAEPSREAAARPGLADDGEHQAARVALLDAEVLDRVLEQGALGRPLPQPLAEPVGHVEQQQVRRLGPRPQGREDRVGVRGAGVAAAARPLGAGRRHRVLVEAQGPAGRGEAVQQPDRAGQPRPEHEVGEVPPSEDVERLLHLAERRVGRGGRQRVRVADLDAVGGGQLGQLGAGDARGAGDGLQLGGRRHPQRPGRVGEPGAGPAPAPLAALPAAAQPRLQRPQVAALGGGEQRGQLAVLGLQPVDQLAVLQLPARPPPALPDLLHPRRDVFPGELVERVADAQVLGGWSPAARAGSSTSRR